jgi:hypothetical protein
MTRPCNWHEAGDRTGYLKDRLPLNGEAFIKAYNEGFETAHEPKQPKTEKGK